jgi:ubiquinone/menaquinone biosynthesis C-methylase UbiE
VTLRERWEEEAPNWIRWAREPDHDSYWRFHRDRFLGSLPAPGRLTLDIGCGEGRVTRDLRGLGHHVVGIDQSASMIAAAQAADPDGEYVEADAAVLPFDDGSAELAISFMSLMDMDDMAGAVREVSRVLGPRGRFVVAVVHPINSAGEFVPRQGVDDAPFVIESYLERRPYADHLERDGLEMTFHSLHFTLEDYSRAFEAAGFLLMELRELYDDENPRWGRVPLFLRWTAVKA